MKKFFIGVMLAALVALSVWCLMTPDDPYSIEEFGTIWYSTPDASVTVKQIDTDEYEVYLCKINEYGVVEDYSKFGIYEKDEVVHGVDKAVNFYWETQQI